MTTPIELPPVDAITAAWWDATREGTLLLQTCHVCGGVQHYPRALCVGCGATEQLGWVPASGAGTVDTWTTVHRAPEPGLEVPYIVARVRLAEGPVLLTNLVDVTPDALAIGCAVRLAWRPLSDGRQLPVFTVVPTDREGP